MAHAIEGYSRPQTGQTIHVKKQIKSTSPNKSQAVRNDDSNVRAAVYTASKFEDVAKNKSTYTAKATYANPVLAKKQSTIAQVAQTNKEATKTTPNALSVAKNFFAGIGDAGVSTVVSIYNMGRHPVQTAKELYNAAAHPNQTAEVIKGIAQELKADFKEGNADVKSHMIGRAVGEIGLAVFGTKMVDKIAKGSKAVSVTKVATGVTEASEETAKAAKAVSAAVKAAEKVEDEVNQLKKVTPNSKELDIIKDSTQETTNPKTRLPRADGHWRGEPGNGQWFSDKTEVKNITGGNPIEFINGRPNFTPWSKGSLKFKEGQLKGTQADFELVYEKIKSIKGFSSKNQAKEWLNQKGLSPHHKSITEIELIPTDLHKNVPHIGSASDLRGGN